MSSIKHLNKTFNALIIATAIIAIYKAFDRFDIILAAAGKIFSIIAPFAVGFGIAYLLNWPCERLEGLIKKSRRGFVRSCARALSVALVYTVIFGVAAATLFYAIPAMYSGAREIVANLPEYLSAANKYRNIIPQAPKLQDIIAKYDPKIFAAGFFGVTSGIVSVVLAVVVSIYALLGKEHLLISAERLLSALSKDRNQAKIHQYIGRIGSIISRYFYAQIMDSIIVGGLCILVLLAMRVEFAIPLGMMTGVFNIIPYFGSIFSALLVVLVTLFTSGTTRGLWVAAAMVVLQQIDANIIGPRLMGDSLNIRPIGIIFAVTAGGSLFGVWGMFLAVPICAMLKTVFMEYLVYIEERKNGDL